MLLLLFKKNAFAICAHALPGSFVRQQPQKLSRAADCLHPTTVPSRARRCEWRRAGWTTGTSRGCRASSCASRRSARRRAPSRGGWRTPSLRSRDTSCATSRRSPGTPRLQATLPPVAIRKGIRARTTNETRRTYHPQSHSQPHSQSHRPVRSAEKA
jgi:hypothetical protein